MHLSDGGLFQPHRLGLISSLNLEIISRKCTEKRACNQKDKGVSVCAFAHNCTVNQPTTVFRTEKKNKRGSNVLGTKLRKKPQLTDVKTGRQLCKQTIGHRVCA